jgi:uncharacterized protein DUF6794
MRQVSALHVIGLTTCALLVGIVIDGALAQQVPASKNPAIALEGGPNTLEDAFRILDKNLPPIEKSTFKRTPEKQAAIKAHFGLGLWIRNEWLYRERSGLRDYLASLGARHIDDMSGMVLVSYWRHLNDKPIEIEKQVACYRRWWEEWDRRAAEGKHGSPPDGPDFDCP